MMNRRQKVEKGLVENVSITYTLEGYYSEGWEEVTSASTYKEIKADLKSYYENEKGTYRVFYRYCVNGKEGRRNYI